MGSNQINQPLSRVILQFRYFCFLKNFVELFVGYCNMIIVNYFKSFLETRVMFGSKAHPCKWSKQIQTRLHACYKFPAVFPLTPNFKSKDILPLEKFQMKTFN